jgi:NitT/TauT family transport system substrate-binding protein
MDSARRRFLVAGWLLPLALAGGCSEPPPLVRVGGITWIGYEPLFLARELGLYEADGLRLVEMPSNSATLMQLATGDLEAAALTLDEYLLAREGGLDVRAILVFDYSAGADVVMSHPAIARLTDLRGRRIGVEENAASALMLAKVLEAAGLRAEEVVKVRLTADRQLSAYLTGDIDAVVSWEPIATQLQQAGARRLFDSKAFPGLIVDVLVARADALERSPAAFQQLLDGYFRALAHLHASPDDAFQRMSPRLGMTAAAVRAAYQGIHFVALAANRAWLDGPEPTLRNAVAALGRVMLANGLLRRPPALDGLADARFLPEVPR